MEYCELRIVGLMAKSAVRLMFIVPDAVAADDNIHRRKPRKFEHEKL